MFEIIFDPVLSITGVPTYIDSSFTLLLFEKEKHNISH